MYPQQSDHYIIRASGCGKSTAANLLMRFYTANAGELNLDGRDIKEYNVKWLRSQIGYVAQVLFIFKQFRGSDCIITLSLRIGAISIFRIDCPEHCRWIS